MAKPKSDTQVTPEGYEIPVPKRGAFDAHLDKLLKAPQPPEKVAGRRGETAAPPVAEQELRVDIETDAVVLGHPDDFGNVRT
jgi:hypothetical protein